MEFFKGRVGNFHLDFLNYFSQKVNVLVLIKKDFNEFSKTHPTFVSLELKRQLKRKLKRELKRELNQRNSSEGAQAKELKQWSSSKGAQERAQKKKLKRALKRAFRGLTVTVDAAYEV